MKIISWNLSCFRKQGAFEYALKHLNADVYFFQECQHPLTYLTRAAHKELIGKYIWEPTENGWGNCTLSIGEPVQIIDVETKFKGRVLVGKLRSRDIVLVNLHVPVTDGWSRYNLKSMFEEIMPLQKDDSAIVAGDLNFGVYSDKNGKTEHRDWLQKLLGQNKLVSCFHKFHEKEKQTFRASRKAAECMLDYIFATMDLETRVKACDVLKDESIVAMSDHNPVLAEITL